MAEKVHKLADVFGVSRDIPLSYQERADVDARLVDNLSRDKHVVIYGASKQGKTCLRKHCLSDDDYITVQCQNTWGLDEVCTSILKAAGFEVEVSSAVTVSGSRKLKASFKVGVPLIKTEIGAGSETENTSIVTTAPLSLDPKDPNDLARALNSIKFKKFVVLEDFHYLPQETQEQFSYALKAIHEMSSVTFIVVAVWKEENRLIVLNGDLTGRVVSVDADVWRDEDLLGVISNGESLLNVSFPQAFKNELIAKALSSVYIVQDSCYRACSAYGKFETQAEHFEFPDDLSAEEYIRPSIAEQSARYTTFLVNFAEGFQDTNLQMYRWLLYPILKASKEELKDGLLYSTIRKDIQSRHPQASQLNPGNLTQALYSIGNLQSKKNIKPFILDYDRSNLRLSVVDRGFLIWLSTQDRKSLADMIELPSEDIT